MGNFNNENSMYTINAIAFFRQDVAVSLTDTGSNTEFQTDINGMKLFQLYYQMLHPLSGLYYSFDPSLPKIFYFLTLFIRILLIYVFSFALFKDSTSGVYIENNRNGAAITFSLLFSLLCLPLPFWALKPCRNRYFLSRGAFDNDDEDDEEDEDADEDEDEEEEGTTKPDKRLTHQQRMDTQRKQQEEISNMKKVYVSLNLPLRLMFLINANKTTDLLTGKVTLPYASGEAEQVVSSIFQIKSGSVDPERQENKDKPKESERHQRLASQVPLVQETKPEQSEDKPATATGTATGTSQGPKESDTKTGEEAKKADEEDEFDDDLGDDHDTKARSKVLESSP